MVVAPRGEFEAEALHAFLAKPGQGIANLRLQDMVEAPLASGAKV
jgi:hypothetical protein